MQDELDPIQVSPKFKENLNINSKKKGGEGVGVGVGVWGREKTKGKGNTSFTIFKVQYPSSWYRTSRTLSKLDQFNAAWVDYILQQDVLDNIPNVQFKEGKKEQTNLLYSHSQGFSHQGVGNSCRNKKM